MKRNITNSITRLCRTFLLIVFMLWGALQVNAQISVTATAGTAGPTPYTTLHDAFAAINAGTHQGVINVSVTANTTETVNDTLLQSASPSNYTWVTIQPATSATIRCGSKAIFFFGAANVTIEGSNAVGGTTRVLTITGSSNIIRFGTPSTSVGCSNDTVRNCTITSSSGPTGTAAIISGGTTAGSSGLAPTARITIQNNGITGSPGINVNGVAAMDTNWTITGNTMSGFYSNCITITNGYNPVISNNTITGILGNNSLSSSIEISISGGQNTTIYGNTITAVRWGSGGSTSASGFAAWSYIGIQVTNGQGVVIDSNNITGPTLAGSLTVSGGSGVWMISSIYINSGQATIIRKNTLTGPTSFKLNSAIISGIRLSSNITGADIYSNQISGINNPNAYGAYGIYVTPISPGSNINIYNNFIADISGQVGGSISAAGHGIYMDQGDGVNIYHNTINQSVEQPGAYSGCPGSACICLNPVGSSFANVNVEDNILQNLQTLGSPYSLYSSATTASFGAIDYNDYYAPTGNMGYIGGTALNTIAAMQTGFGGNVNSISFAPVFVGPPDLHVQVISANAPLNAGTLITSPSITTDIDGDPRFSPTIGADELILCTVAAIGGTPTLCSGSTTALTDATTGGTWSSSNTAVATVDPATGIVSGVSAGSATISYSTTCSVTKVVTVGTLPITGNTTFCAGSTTYLSDATPGGVWSSDNTGVATVSTTGAVLGVTAGTANISYTFGSCTAVSTSVTAVTVALITGTTTLCSGSTTSLTDATPGGTWSSDNTSIATVDPAGTVSGISAGMAGITYMVGSCPTSVTVTVGTLPINGPANVCTGTTVTFSDGTPGGVWSSSNTGVATVSTTGDVTGSTPGTANITYTLGSCIPVSIPISVVTLAPITPSTSVTICMGSSTTLTDVTTGGTWSSGSTGIAGVSSTGTVTAVSAGTAIISYSLGSCSVLDTVIVGGTLPAITGPTTVCSGATIALSDATAGGVWSSGSTSIATVSGVGVVSGVSAGTATISYTVGSCSVSVMITVSTLPPITGGTSVCVSGTLALSDATPGGMWSSGGTTAATVDPVTGVVTGVASGSATIYYTVGACTVSILVTVGSPIAAITGATALCIGSTTVLNDATPAGAWSSTNTAVATISGTGVVSGVSSGSTTISYTVGSCSVTLLVTVLPSNAGTITGKDSLCIGPAHVITLSDNVSGGAWSSSSTARATVGSATGVVSGVTTGTVTITYTVTNSCGTFKATKVLYVRTAAQCATGINGTQEQLTELKVFPNPNKGVFTVNLQSAEADEEVHVVVTNIVGEKVRELTTTTNKAVEIKLAPAAGIYLLSASTANGRYNVKVVVD